MKTYKKIRLISFLWLLFISLVVSAQTDKKAALVSKSEKAMKTAEMKVALNEKKIADSDSLIQLGTQMITDAKTEYKAIVEANKKLDKDYGVNQKPLVKLVKSDDKQEAAKAGKDLKAMDMQYKADAKVLNTRNKNAAKMETKGKANISKGKKSKKSAQSALKSSQAALATATEKYQASIATSE